LLFDGTLSPADGALCPDPARPGTGLELRAADGEQFLIHSSAHTND
jgi:hypothetical protein